MENGSAFYPFGAPTRFLSGAYGDPAVSFRRGKGDVTHRTMGAQPHSYRGVMSWLSMTTGIERRWGSIEHVLERGE